MSIQKKYQQHTHFSSVVQLYPTLCDTMYVYFNLLLHRLVLDTKQLPN